MFRSVVIISWEFLNIDKAYIKHGRVTKHILLNQMLCPVQYGVSLL